MTTNEYARQYALPVSEGGPRDGADLSNVGESFFVWWVSATRGVSIASAVEEGRALFVARPGARS